MYAGAGPLQLRHVGTVQFGNCGKENDVMGMLASWVQQLTQPLRSLKWGLLRMKQTLLSPFIRQKALGRGVVNDARQLARSAGVGQKPKEQPRPPSPPPKRR
jgi:hypothetical protein